MNWKDILQSQWDRLLRFSRFVIQHFFEDDCPYRASALAFTSLLAIVPLMSVGFAILSSFPVFEGLSQPIQDFIFDNFVPATGKIVQAYLQQFTAQVAKLSVFGVLFLFITTILLMLTIERAMNKIWHTSTARHGIAAFLLYWAILSLSPIFLGLSLAASSYFISIPFFQTEAPSFIFASLPFILSLMGFTFLYVVVPNCPVSLRHGLLGGFIAALLFESAKQAFAFYLSRYNAYELLYGAFAAVPLFFVWVYWVWLITLLGAEVSYALSVHYKRRLGEPLDGFSHALLWLQQLWLKQKEGQGMTFNELIETSNQPFAVDSSRMLNQLKKLHLIQYTEEGNIILSRDLSDVTLYWLRQELPYHLPTHSPLNNVKQNALFEEGDKFLQQLLGISLAEWFETQ